MKVEKNQHQEHFLHQISFTFKIVKRVGECLSKRNGKWYRGNYTRNLITKERFTLENILL